MDAIPKCIQDVESSVSTLTASLEGLTIKLHDSLKLTGDQEVLGPIVFTGNQCLQKTCFKLKSNVQCFTKCLIW